MLLRKKDEELRQKLGSKSVKQENIPLLRNCKVKCSIKDFKYIDALKDGINKNIESENEIKQVEIQVAL